MCITFCSNTVVSVYKFDINLHIPSMKNHCYKPACVMERVTAAWYSVQEWRCWRRISSVKMQSVTCSTVNFYTRFNPSTGTQMPQLYRPSENNNDSTPDNTWRGGVMGKAFGLAISGRIFKFCSGQRCVTTLGGSY